MKSRAGENFALFFCSTCCLGIGTVIKLLMRIGILKKKGLLVNMDTKCFYLIDTEQDKKLLQSIPTVEEQKRETLLKYIRISEEVQEIRQLFRVLKFNIEQLEDKCTINSNDEIFSKKTGKIVDSITINALTINIFSAGKNLIDYIESFFKVVSAH